VLAVLLFSTCRAKHWPLAQGHSAKSEKSQGKGAIGGDYSPCLPAGGSPSKEKARRNRAPGSLHFAVLLALGLAAHGDLSLEGHGFLVIGIDGDGTGRVLPRFV
jgi:hypothetical protein